MKPSAFPVVVTDPESNGYAAGLAPPHHQRGRPVKTACPRVVSHRAVSVRRANRTERPLTRVMRISGYRHAWCAPSTFWWYLVHDLARRATEAAAILAAISRLGRPCSAAARSGSYLVHDRARLVRVIAARIPPAFYSVRPSAASFAALPVPM